jgi:hypothetical protein
VQSLIDQPCAVSSKILEHGASLSGDSDMGRPSVSGVWGSLVSFWRLTAIELAPSASMLHG